MRKPKVKYVVFKNITQEHIVIFPEVLTHIELANSITEMSEYLEPISGGFIDDGKCVGSSVSLDMKSRGEADNLLLKKLLGEE